MSETVDSYQKWLGIPKEDQPPNHYRLLGLELFESDRPTIDGAAKRLMGSLQKQLAGPEQSSIRKLLDELSHARRCLLLSDQKTIYDKKLKTALEAIPEPELIEPESVDAALPIDAPLIEPIDIEPAEEIVAAVPIPDEAVPEAEPMPPEEEEIAAAPEPELIDESQEPLEAESFEPVTLEAATLEAVPIDDLDDAPVAEPFDDFDDIDETDEIEEPTALEQVGELLRPEPTKTVAEVTIPPAVASPTAVPVAAVSKEAAPLKADVQAAPVAPKAATQSTSPAAPPSAPPKPMPQAAPKPQPIAAAAKATTPKVVPKAVEKVEKPIESPEASFAPADSHAWNDSETSSEHEGDGSFFSGMGLSSIRAGGGKGSATAEAIASPDPSGGRGAGQAKDSKYLATKTNSMYSADSQASAAGSKTEGKGAVKKAPQHRGPQMWQIMVGVGGAAVILILVVAAMSGGGSTNTPTPQTRPAATKTDPPRIAFGPHTVTGPINDRTTRSPVTGAPVKVPFERHGDLMLMDVKINDQDAGKFLLDTGTADLIISKAVADKLNLPARHGKNMKMPGGVQSVMQRKVDSVTLGNVRFEEGMIEPEPTNDEWLAIAVDIKPWSDAIGVPISGVIGGEIWSQVPFSIDPANNVVTFFKKGRFPFSTGKKPEFLTRFDNFRKPALTATLDNGPEGTFVIATGVPSELMVKGSADPVKSLSIFGQEISDPAAVESKEGDGYFDSNEIRQSGVIGAGILSHYLLMFDYEHESFMAVRLKK